MQRLEIHAARGLWKAHHVMDRKTLAALAAFGMAALGSAGCGNNETALTSSNETAAAAGSTSLISPSPLASTTTVGSSAMGAGAASGDVVQTALNDPRFSTLAQAVEAAGLAQTLKGAGPYTIFAPTNDAFNKLPPGTLQNLLRPENKAKLASILRYHVLPSRVTAADVRALDNGTSVKTLGGALNVMRQGDSVMVNDAQIVQADLPATNGVLHVIDTVLQPGGNGGNAASGGGGLAAGAGAAGGAMGGMNGGAAPSTGGAPTGRTAIPPPGGGGGYGAPTANGAGRVPGRGAGTGSGIGATAPGGGAAGVSGSAAGSGPTGASNAGGGY